jgi:hypothetical protein
MRRSLLEAPGTVVGWSWEVSTTKEIFGAVALDQP